MARILGIGAATLDHLVLLEDFPSGEGVVQALDSATDGGGPVATALCVLGHLGHECELVDAMAADAMGKQIQAGLARHGVSTNFATETATTAAHAFVQVRQRDGARHIAFVPARDASISRAVVRLAMKEDWDLLYLNGRHEDAALEAMQLAEARRVPIGFDGGAGRFREVMRPMVLASSVRIVALDFAQKYLGLDHSAQELGPKLLEDARAQVVVITDGLRGSYIWSKSGFFMHQPAYDVPTVDTTGCGDVYHGAFLHGWLEQWSLVRTAEYASRLAADNARGLGGRWVLGLG
jgi:sugar/nucleoside kinase (ribokinase family)